MMIPGIVAQRRAGGAAPTLWTPLSMATVPQIYLDAQDSVITNVSGFASAISNLGAMGANGDFSQATADNRPAILAAELNGKRVLRFDGVNDVLLGASAAQKNLFRNASAAWVFAIYKKRTVDVSGDRIYFYVNIGGSGGTRFAASAGTGAGLNKPTLQGRRLDGDAFAGMSHGTAAASAYVGTFVGINYATRSGRIQVDGGSATENPTFTAAAGNTSNTASFAPIGIGAVQNGNAPADIDLATIVASNTQPSATDIDKLFGWAAHKYGLTANLPSGHPYKTVAPTV